MNRSIPLTTVILTVYKKDNLALVHNQHTLKRTTSKLMLQPCRTNYFHKYYYNPKNPKNNPNQKQNPKNNHFPA